MRFFLFPLLVCLAACGASSRSSSGSSNSNPPATTYDMLEWMTMSPTLRDAHHMAGNANPVYTQVQPDRFLWTKSAEGFPWDIQLYDDKYIYLWVTELSWTDPYSYKAFHSAKLGVFNLPLVPRYANGGYPGSTITISDSTYEIHSDCDTYITKNLGYVVNEVWGPYTENLGGDVPQNLTTLVISYRYTCDANYDNCLNKEEYHLAKPYGLVKWQHETLRPDGTYGPPDNVTIFDHVEAGQVTPITACF